MMGRMILIVVGLPGSGKSTTAKFFHRKMIPVVRMGDVTDELLKKDKIPFNEKNEKKYREELRSKFGQEIYSVLLLPKITALFQNYKIIIVEGLRSIAEYDFFKKNLPGIKMIFVDSKKEVRYQRLKNRKTRSLNLAQAKIRDINEENYFKISSLLKYADYVVYNNTTEKNLQNDLEKIYQKFSV